MLERFHARTSSGARPPANLADAALWYAGRGWKVFPIIASTKKPLQGGNGFWDATTDPAQIRLWWANHPDARIALPCRLNGLIAIDADASDGKHGLDTLTKLEAKYGPLPRDLVQRSNGGGLHIVMLDPSPGAGGWTRESCRGNMNHAECGPHVDVKCNGYIIVDPSGKYRWESLGDPPPVPATWIAALRKSERAANEKVEAAATVTADWSQPIWQSKPEHLEQLAKELEPLVQGEGKGTTYAAMKKTFHDWGLSVDEGFPLIDRWNTRHDDGELKRQLERIAERIAEKIETGEISKPRGADHPANNRCWPPPPPPPTSDEMLAELQAERARLAAKKKEKGAQLEKKALDRLLTGKLGDVPDSERDSALRAMARVGLKYAPRATDEQIAALMMKAVGTVERALPYVHQAREVLQREDPDARRAGNDNRSVVGDEFSVDDEGKPYATKQGNIDVALAKLNVSVRWDSFGERALIEGLEGFGPYLDDGAAVRLLLKIDEEFGFRPAKDFFYDVLTDRARLNSFHPVCDYLDSLVWDETPRLDRWLIDLAGVEDTPYTRAVSRIVLVAAVRRVRQPGCKFDEMLVIEDPRQGTGKSTALAILAARDEWFSDNLPLGADAQRAIESIAGKWIIEAGELHGMRGSEDAALKSFLSRRVDRARMAYGRMPIELPRQCIIIGTTNDAEYLKDRTGNRRYWPVRIRRPFDLECLRAERDQLWAEAARLEAAGESIRLDPSLYEAAGEQQEQRVAADPWVEELQDWWPKVSSERRQKGLAMADIAEEVFGIGVADIKRHERHLSAALRSAGLESRKGGKERRALWFAAERKPWLE